MGPGWGRLQTGSSATTDALPTARPRRTPSGAVGGCAAARMPRSHPRATPRPYLHPVERNFKLSWGTRPGVQRPAGFSSGSVSVYIRILAIKWVSLFSEQTDGSTMERRTVYVATIVAMLAMVGGWALATTTTTAELTENSNITTSRPGPGSPSQR